MIMRRTGLFLTLGVAFGCASAEYLSGPETGSAAKTESVEPADKPSRVTVEVSGERESGPARDEDDLAPAAEAATPMAPPKPKSAERLGLEEVAIGTRGRGSGGRADGVGSGRGGVASKAAGSAAKARKKRPAPRPTRRATPSSPGVKAGAADDNLQFNAFVRFNEENGKLGLAHIIDDRIVVEVVDRKGRPVSGARVLVDGTPRRITYADGRALLHPRRWGVGPQASLAIEGAGSRVESNLGSAKGRKIQVRLAADRGRFDAVPLDVAFILDTTGSMGDELTKLRDTLDVITFQISHMKPQPRLRLGMVLYRDRGDAYVTRVVPMTSDLKKFESALAKVSAGGGGDTPEDLQAGLEVALHQLKWRQEGLRLAFVVGDAPPHLDYGQQFTYVDALEEAASRAIKITTIGASGLDRRGELIWRQLAQATMAPFVFLTYGESGNSEGSPSTVSHHVGSNWVAADLDAIIVKMVKVELSHFSDRGLEPRDDWFSATSHPDKPADDVLEELFERSMKQLVDYAVEPLKARTPTVLLPLSMRVKARKEARSKLERRLALGLSRKGEFQLLETEKQGEILEALADQMSLAYDEEKMVKAGKLLPAELAVLGQVGGGDPGQLEMLLKLVRLETGEVLSLSLLKIDEKLVL